MRQLLFLFSASLFLYPFASASACGDVVKKEDILLKRAAKQNDHCVDLYIRYPKMSGSLIAQWPRLSGKNFSVKLNKFVSVSDETFQTSYFCLSASALETSTITLRYEEGSCVNILDLENLDEMLKKSDKASGYESSD